MKTFAPFLLAAFFLFAPYAQSACNMHQLISGKFTDNYGGTHEIDAHTWTMKGAGNSVFHIIQQSEEESYLIAKNDGANPFDPGLYSRFDIVAKGDGSFQFCQTSYNSPSEDLAAGVAKAKVDAAATDGCAGFPFSTLTPVSKGAKEARGIAQKSDKNGIPRKGADSVKNKLFKK